MARFWTVTASVTVRSSDGWESTRQVPTFVIDGMVQGARNVEDAERIARSVIMTATSPGFVVAVAVHAHPLYV